MEGLDKFLIGIAVITAGVSVWSGIQTIRNICLSKAAIDQFTQFELAKNRDKQNISKNYIQRAGTQGVPFLIRSTQKFYHLNDIEPVRIDITGRSVEKVYKSVMGLPFTLHKIGSNDPAIRCQVNEAKVNSNAFQFQLLPDTPSSQSWWYSFLSVFPITDLEQRHSRVKTCLTLNLSGMSIYGILKIDELNELQLDVKFIAKLASDIQNYFTQKKDYFFGYTLINASIALILGFATISALNELYSRYKERRNKVGAEADREHRLKCRYILARSSDKLMCRLCFGQPANIVMNCCHLVMCQECYSLGNTICPECDQYSDYYAKLFCS